MSRHHSIDYIEFSVTDMQAAKDFYSKVFGWEFTDYAPVYAGIKKIGGGEMGGLTLAENVVSGGPLIVLYSENLKDSFKKAQEAGAHITKEIFEFPGGKRFELQDLSGNNLAVWSES